MEVASLVLESLEAPASVMKTILIILVIGFPVWLVFSWVYDLTPEGITKTKNTDTKLSKSPKINLRLNRAIIAFLSIAVVLLAVNQLRSSTFKKNESAKPFEKSIAVLPFTNVSGDEEQDYFCYGIA